MNKILPFLLLVSCQSFAQSQEWERVLLKDVGYLSIPPTMEVQDKNYKAAIDELMAINKNDSLRLVIQQKGLNKLEKDALKRYLRVIVETTIGVFGDYDKLDFDIGRYTLSEIQEADAYFEGMVKQDFIGTKFTLLQWYPLVIEKINGYSSLHIKYKRQLNNKPPVIVNNYILMNNDRMHTITIEYRWEEEVYWKLDLEKVLASFEITNKR